MRSRGFAACLLAAGLAATAALARSPGQGALDEGVALYKRGEYNGAAESFRRAVDLDPSLMKAWENLGWAQHRLGRDDEALRVWRTVLKLEPGNVDAWNAVGEVETARGAWTSAAGAFEKSLERDPDQPDARLRLGQAYEELGRNDAAASQYRAILAKRRGHPKATQRLADLYEREGRLDEAEDLLRGTPFTDRLARVLAKKGDAAYAAEEWAAAARTYREASEREPKDPRYAANLGWALSRSGDPAGAVAAWKRAIDLGASEPAKLWRAVGDASRDLGDVRAARAAYLKAAALDPAAAGLLYPLAEMSMEAGDTAAATATLDEMFGRKSVAEEDFVRAADLFIRTDATDAGLAFFTAQRARPGRSGPSRVALGRLHAARGGAAYRAGDDAAATRAYRAALEADPRCRAALRDFGWVQWRSADWPGVESTWSGYGRAYPDLAEPHELLGRFHLHQGRPKEAIADAERALAAAPADPGTASLLLTRALLADGRYVRARALAAGLAASRPNDLAAQTLYGEALWRSLDYPASRDQWRKVLDLGSDSPRAMHYWLRSLYETGAYDEAIAAARSAAAKGTASEPVLRLLAEDAAVRGDTGAVVRWYERLTDTWPQRVAYWVALADAYDREGKLGAKERTLQEALRRHPDRSELALALADTHRALGRNARALEEYESLGARLGRNRTAFLGRVRALNALGRGDEALALLDGADAELLMPDERALEEASILEGLGRRTEAAARRATVSERKPGRVEVAILLYHGIAEHERTVNMPLDHFDEQMRAIRDAGYTTITIAELDGMLRRGRPFPAKPILVTFDDARSDSFQWADPVLRRYGMRATMFVPTVRIADESPSNADWGALRDLRATGRWDFQSHGHLAHDPIPVDDHGGMAEFLVNRQWLPEIGRLETHEEFARRIEADYVGCKTLIEENLPGQASIAYAFPFSEMGQLHGGNEPDALALNETSYRAHYLYGLVQDASGYNVLEAGAPGPMLLRRINVPREWDGDRLMAHLEVEAPAEQARLEAAKWDLWSGRLGRAEDELKAIDADNPGANYATGIYLARTLSEQDRPHEAAAALAAVPAGPAWDPPDPATKRLALDIAWDTDPSAGVEARVVSDADGRDQRELSATGRLPLGTSIDLWGEAGTVKFEDAVFPEIDGQQLTLGARWQAFDHGAFGGWVRGRDLTLDTRTLNGEVSFTGRLDRHRYGIACGIEDVPTAGALEAEVLARGCDLSYQFGTRLWRFRGRGGYQSLSDGNSLTAAWGDGLRALGAKRWFEAGGRVELADSQGESPLYYTPQKLFTAMALARYRRVFAFRTILEAEAGVGPSRDETAGTRIVARGRAAWTQDWTRRLRSTLTFEYGQTPDYHRTSVGFALGYRF